MVNPDGVCKLQDEADQTLQNPHAEPDAETDLEAIPLVSIKDSKITGEAGGAAEEANESTVKKPKTDFSGLTKEELEKFVNDPFWRRLRLILFIVFWVIWVGMLAAVIIIIVVSPKCPPRPTRYFWQKPFYRIQVKSFAQDPSAGATGTGTVEGLIEKLGYLRSTLGFDNYILDSLVSPAAGTGCPIDFKALNSSLGSLETLKAFTKQGRKKGFSILMEFDASQADIAWQSADGSDGFYTSAVELPKLASRDGGKAWHTNQRLHLPRSTCPSLNVSSPGVQAKLEEALTFWLDAGLSGFVLTNVAFMSPLSENSVSATDSWFDVDPTPLLFSNASVNYVRSVRRFLNAQAEKRGRELALFVDPGNTGFAQPEARLAAYLDPAAGAHAVVSTSLGVPLSPRAPSETRTPQKIIQTTLDVVGNNGGVLFATAWPWLRRPNESFWTALSLTLPGVPCLYYGQELGMAHVPGVRFRGAGLTSYLTANDSTDVSQTPMQWSDSLNAGWLKGNDSTPLAWIDLMLRAADIERHNLRLLSSAGHPFSQLQLVKRLVQLVNSKESLQWGVLTFLTNTAGSSTLPAGVIAFKRHAERFPPVIVVINAVDKARTLDLSYAGAAKGTLKIMHSSAREATSSYEIDKDYSLSRVFAPAKSILVFLGIDD